MMYWLADDDGERLAIAAAIRVRSVEQSKLVKNQGLTKFIVAAPLPPLVFCFFFPFQFDFDLLISSLSTIHFSVASATLKAAFSSHFFYNKCLCIIKYHLLNTCKVKF